MTLKAVAQVFDQEEHSEDAIVHATLSRKNSLVGRPLGDRDKITKCMNENLEKFVFKKEVDDIAQECYKHWLASSELDVCEINPILTDGVLTIGGYDQPMASAFGIHGTQMDGGTHFRGIFLIDETTILIRSTIQTSKSSKTAHIRELRATSYICRVFKCVDKVWKISPIGVYYQLRAFSGNKRTLITVQDNSSQTELSYKPLDKVVDMLSPEGGV